jgi:hypothetical protein
VHFWFLREQKRAFHVEHNLRSNAKVIRTQVFGQKHSNGECDLRVSGSWNFAVTPRYPTRRVLLLFRMAGSDGTLPGDAGICKKQVPHPPGKGGGFGMTCGLGWRKKNNVLPEVTD